MPILIVLSVSLQLLCLLHMARSGRPYWWAWIILIGSFMGVAVYVITQVLPDLRDDPRARRAARNLARSIDPQRERRRIEAQLGVADTVQNRMRLADESLQLGDFVNAAELYASCLKGPHATDPHLLLGLAQAQFGSGDAIAARHSLESLIEHNPDFRSHDGHLLYARCLEALGEDARAELEYEVLARSYPGEEARARYALLLERAGRHADAHGVLRDMQARAKVAPGYYRRAQREWLQLAEQKLAERA